MKYLMVFLMSGCVVGNGRYVGKLVDVSWEGLFYKSCEIRQVNNVATSGHEDKASSLDHNLCTELEKHLNENIELKYESLFLEPGFILGSETAYRVIDFRVVK